VVFLDAAQLRARAAHYFGVARDSTEKPNAERAWLTAQDYLQRARDIEEGDRHLMPKN
jgi:hypothetical protein